MWRRGWSLTRAGFQHRVKYALTFFHRSLPVWLPLTMLGEIRISAAVVIRPKDDRPFCLSVHHGVLPSDLQVVVGDLSLARRGRVDNPLPPLHPQILSIYHHQ